MTEIQEKSLMVRVSAKFELTSWGLELSGVDCRIISYLQMWLNWSRGVTVCAIIVHHSGTDLPILLDLSIAHWLIYQQQLKILLFQKLHENATLTQFSVVLVRWAKMTQVTRNENHFSTWNALSHFGICSDSFKLLSKTRLGLGEIKYDKKER